MKLQAIYEPKGRAGEYSRLALNVYRTCVHGCRYCYVPGATRMKVRDFHLFPALLSRMVNTRSSVSWLIFPLDKSWYLCYTLSEYETRKTDKPRTRNYLRPGRPTQRVSAIRVSYSPGRGRKEVSMTQVERVEKKIAEVRGKARTRTVDGRDLLQVLDEARTNGYGLRAGATVANSYGFVASRMRLLAVRGPKCYGVKVNWGNASRGASEFPDGGRQDANIRECARLQKRGFPRKAGWLRIPTAEVTVILAERRLRARVEAQREWPEPVPQVEVTRDDSLRAGNCERETERVAKWFGDRVAIPASELRQTILSREPEIAYYARRAVEAAAARVTV